MPGGRPSDYSPELGQEIAERVATDLTPLRELCASQAHWPAIMTLYRWEEAHPEFREAMSRARTVRADVAMDDAVDALRHVDPGAQPKVGGALVQKGKYLVDAEARRAARLSPRNWSERHAHEVAGPGGGPVRTEQSPDLSQLSEEEVREWRRLRAKAEGERA